MDSREQLRTVLAVALVLSPLPANAADGLFSNAPASQRTPVARLAVQYDLKMTIPKGGDFARMLSDAGIDTVDALAADRLSIEDIAASTCFAELSITKGIDGNGFRLVRVLLTTTDGRRTIVERRGNELTIASKTPPRTSLRLV